MTDKTKAEELLKQEKERLFTYQEVRAMTEAALKERARYIGCFYKVMPKEMFDQYAREAMKEYGIFRVTMGQYKGEPGDHAAFAQMLAANVVNNTNSDIHFIAKADEEQTVVRLTGKCGLVERWIDMGFTPEEVDYLCEVVCEADYAYTDRLGLNARFVCTNAQPDSHCCDMVVKKKA